MYGLGEFFREISGLDCFSFQPEGDGTSSVLGLSYPELYLVTIAHLSLIPRLCHRYFSGADHIHHVSTQLPYALTVAVVVFAMYVLYGLFRVSHVVLISLGMVILLVLQRILRREKRKTKAPRPKGEGLISSWQSLGDSNPCYRAENPVS